MAIKLMSTKDIAVQGVKILVHGVSGAGKTTLIRTLRNPLIISAEAGLLSLHGTDIPYVVVNTIADLHEAYAYVVEHMNEYETICLDSISEIAEVFLSAEKKVAKDPRQAYGAMQDQVSDIIRAFRDLVGIDVYFSAKTEKSQDETGRLLWAPSLPGNKMGQQVPYFFDEVLALRVERDAEGSSQRALMTDTDGLWTAKDRSGKLDIWEAPDLGAVIAKIKGETV